MIKSVWGITLSVSDLKKAVSFYERTLGLNKKYEYSSYAGFQCGGVEIGPRPGGKKKERIEGAPSIEFFVNNVDAVYQKLKKKGVKSSKNPTTCLGEAEKQASSTLTKIHWKSCKLIGKNISR